MILLIAGATFREAVRSRTFLSLLGLFALGALLARVVGWISATDGHVVTVSLVLSLQSLIGVLVAVAMGTVLVQSEIQHKTLYTVLSRPLPRWHYVLGKYLGLAGALALGQVAMAVIGLGWAWVTGASLSPWLAVAVLLTTAEVLVMAAVSLCWTALSSPLLAAVLGLATYALGHAVATLPGLLHHLTGWKQEAVVILAGLIPNLGPFTYRDQAVHGLPIAWGDLAQRLGYAGLWIALLVVVTISVVRRRQL